MRFIHLTIMFFIILSCKQEKKVILLEKENFSISYPKHLILDENSEEGIVLAIKTLKENKDDTFIDNVNLIVNNSNGLSFSEIIQKTIKDISVITNIQESKNIKLNGKDCLRIIFELNMQDVNLKVIQHLILENGKLYLFTVTCEKKNFSKYFNDFNSILLSFKVGNNG